jgi:chromate transporter
MLTSRHRTLWIIAALVTAAFSALDIVTRSRLVAWAFIGAAAAAAAMLARGVPGGPVAPRPTAFGVREGPRAADEYAPPLRALWRECLLLGLTGFGGGLAVLSNIDRRLVGRRRWIRERTFLETAALAQSLPGAASANMLALIGLRLRGFSGAVTAVGGFILPSFLILLGFALVYGRVRSMGVVDGLFHGLRPAVAGLVAATALRMGGRLAFEPQGRPGGWTLLVRDHWALGVMLASGIAVAFVNLGVVEVLLLAGMVGLIRGRLLGRIDPIKLVESQWRWLRRRAWSIARSEPVAGWRRWLRDRDDDLFAIAPLSFPMMGPGFPGAWRALGDLCGIFLRAGATTFGGGFVMIPLLENELVRARGWLTPEAFADAMALGQITPGPVVITATFVGYTLSGLTGAILATISVFLPAFLLVLVVGGSAQRFRQMSGVQSFLQGLQPAVVGVMFAAAIALLRSAGVTPFSLAIALVAFAILALWRINSAWVLLGGSLAGLAARAFGV